MKPTDDRFTLEDMKAEIDAIVSSQGHPNRAVLSAEQKEVLRYAVESGMYWEAISALWKRNGWEGYSPNTLRRNYREIKNES